MSEPVFAISVSGGRVIFETVTESGSIGLGVTPKAARIFAKLIVLAADEIESGEHAQRKHATGGEG